MKFIKVLTVLLITVIPFNTRSIIQYKPKNCNLHDGTWYEIRAYYQNTYNHFRIKYISPFRYKINIFHAQKKELRELKNILPKKSKITIESSYNRSVYGVDMEELTIHVSNSNNILDQLDEDVDQVYLIDHLYRVYLIENL